MAPPRYGMETQADLYTPRQLVGLTTFADLIAAARERAHRDALSAGMEDDSVSLSDGGSGATAYADAVKVYLGMSVSRLANRGSTLCFWDNDGEKIQQVFARQVYPMTWDFVEANPFSNSTGNFLGQLKYLANVVASSPRDKVTGIARQEDATAAGNTNKPLISTDPPYYDSVPYADLSDFFYVWLRRLIGDVYPGLFGTMLVPKAQELVADQKRHGGPDNAKAFFEAGLGQSFDHMREAAHPDYPVTVYYAFKQAESRIAKDGKRNAASTGWETMLEGLSEAGFQITGTWPMRTELTGNLKKKLNALASSVVLVCRPRPATAAPATRQEFVRALRRELPDALSVMMAENVAPVDLAQATIGPGMAIYSRYSKVVEADGSPMRVRTALQIINQSLDEHLSEAEGNVDSHSRFALTWFEQRGMQDGPYGEAETIASARAVSVRGVQDAGILEARAGKVHLIPREKLAEGWDPSTDDRLTDWEVVQHLIRALGTEGETGAARLLAKVGEMGEGARDLAYRLYGICERKKWAEEALAYNGLVVSWPEITRLAAENPEGDDPQTSMEF